MAAQLDTEIRMDVGLLPSEKSAEKPSAKAAEKPAEKTTEEPAEK